jgi:preprotein translocase subunit SecE
VNRETKRMNDRRNRGAAARSATGSTATEDETFDAAGLAELGNLGPVAPARARGRSPQQRTTPVRFAREIRDELRQVAWPSRAELVNYTAVVVVTLVIMVLLIFLLNYAFGKGVFFMFQK